MVEPVFPIREGSNFPYPGNANERPRLRVARAASAANTLVANYHYLCRRGARKFWRTGLERSDLEQVAALGLIKASRRYDAATRTPFEAYAWLMIVGELMHHVRDYERLVRVPRRLRDLERRYTRAHDALSIRLGREPSDAEVAGELGVVARTLGDVRRARESALVETLETSEIGRLHAADMYASDEHLLVEAAFTALGELERRIIVGVYLLGLTQLELGRRLGISAKRVSRAHHAALVELKRACVS